MFRLIRRLILSLFVGVIAFGVVGWLCLPKPTWSIELPATASRFIDRVDDSSDDEPIWIECKTLDLVAVRANDGAMLQYIPFANYGKSIADLAALPDGRLAVDPVNNGEKPNRRRFYLFGTAQSEPLSSVIFVGDWSITDDWLHAWKMEQRARGFVFECRETQTGTLTRRLEFPDGLKPAFGGFIDYSASSDLFAVSEIAQSGSKPPYGIEIREGSTGKLLKTIRDGIPGNQETGPVSLYFVSGGRYLNFEMPTTAPPFLPRRCTLDVRRGTVRSYDPADVPTDSKGPTDVRIQSYPDGRQIWTYRTLERPAVWVSLVRAESSSTTWRQFPFDVFLERKQISNGAQPPNQQSGAWSKLIPQKSEIIVCTTEESLRSSLPKTVDSLLPAKWGKRERVMRSRWHDWERNEWRLVGCPDDLVDAQIRSNALLSISDSGGQHSILQSWPLPPRDPKRPASAAALIVVAATWWLCRRRAARVKSKAAMV